MMANVTVRYTGLPPADLTQVRRLLRQREFRRALETLDRHIYDTDGTVSVADVRTYAYERLRREGGSPSRRTPVNLRRGMPVSLRRPIPVDLNRLDRAARERVLRWLLAGELRAAEEALRAGDYDAAVTAVELAARIDDRCTRVALVHARALYELVVVAMGDQPPDLDDVAGQLQLAGRLADRAASDPALREPYLKLSAAIDNVAGIVERRRARTARIEAVSGVVQRLDRLVEHYNRSQIVSHVQLGNARASLAQIRAEVDKLSRQHEPDSPAGRILADLRAKCSQYKEYLERRGRTVRAD
jgi:hypothetical protein